ncbi:1-(5-phosphoribosyl)-5-[(5-phosphoribosylamino)methylideneamino]imidazole-4-carboxamide isomerase [Virgibacillus siamensis]|uniref:1-(5-phosphoribosyl)-5-[(5- phosphoribosylamino)methylideneamino]imidazole-4- carboxamide isomerase n=1 Tax=Virgibacillus siamensis TaxID=480071 RepID=UPI0009850622|nr:1-(5-phosphoribosyl)-5-[(5-phosphoribosylamino)methylideneamino]imidazole-4-carboxamide isomerase [Virgibacillus siamensis]
MILFPAIDIRNGKCVRLKQGDYNQEKVYNDSPVKVAREWQQKKASYLHVVDLDGAKTGNATNLDTLTQIVNAADIPVQAGGGIRSLKQIREYIGAGVDRIILGTAAITDKSLLKEAVSEYGSKIAVSIDARKGYVATDGWTETSNVKAVELVKELEQIGVQTIVYTDILKDGMLKGPNFKELQTINEAASMNVIASGGITTEADVALLSEMKLYGAIIGKALYDGTLNFASLMEGDVNAR